MLKKLLILGMLVTSLFGQVKELSAENFDRAIKRGVVVIEFYAGWNEANIVKILDDWEKKRNDAALKGTLLHERIEDFYNQKFHTEYPPEFEYFKNFHNKYEKLEAYRTEWRIYDDSLSIAGTVDMVYKKENNELSLIHI